MLHDQRRMAINDREQFDPVMEAGRAGKTKFLISLLMLLAEGEQMRKL